MRGMGEQVGCDLVEESCKLEIRIDVTMGIICSRNVHSHSHGHQYDFPQYPSLRASNAKFDPTVLLALLPIHFPTSGPSTLYLVPNGTLLSPFVR